MSEPLICCVCLDPGGRPDFTARAEQCFQRQDCDAEAVWLRYDTHGLLDTIGHMRNTANSSEPIQANFFAHWDWDDWSAPDRLSIQLAHIQKTGKLVTGFYSMLFYDAVRDEVHLYEHEDHRYALGTSLFYRREAWQQHKFPDCTPEDNKWRMAVGMDNCS